MTRPPENKQTVEALAGKVYKALDYYCIGEGYGLDQYDTARAALCDLAVQADRAAELEAALEVARDLLASEGYDTDPDYTQEWATVSGPLAGDGGGADG